VAASIEELSFEISAEAVAEQERTLSGLRTRAGTVVAAASIAGSFLGAAASRGALDASAVLALIAFTASLASSIWILLPHELVFAFRGDALLAESGRREVEDVTEAYRALSGWLGPILDANSRKISALSNWFTVSCILLAAEIILWTVSLAS
jgi:hypothetical protein